VVEESQQQVVISVRIDQDAGLVIYPQLRPGDDLEELVVRALSTGQHDERIR
jgi:hypothetical protein